MAVSYTHLDVYKRQNKELFLAGLSNTTSVGLIVAGLVVGVLQIVGFVFDVKMCIRDRLRCGLAQLAAEIFDGGYLVRHRV